MTAWTTTIEGRASIPRFTLLDLVVTALDHDLGNAPAFVRLAAQFDRFTDDEIDTYVAALPVEFRDDRLAADLLDWRDRNQHRGA